MSAKRILLAIVLSSLYATTALAQTQGHPTPPSLTTSAIERITFESAAESAQTTLSTPRYSATRKSPYRTFAQDVNNDAKRALARGARFYAA